MTLRVLVNGAVQPDSVPVTCVTVRDLRHSLGNTHPALLQEDGWVAVSHGQQLGDSRKLSYLSEIEFRTTAASVKREAGSATVVAVAHKTGVKRGRDEGGDAAFETNTLRSPEGTSSSSSLTSAPPLTIPIVVGNVAQWLGPEANAAKSHQWWVYVRGPQNEDLSAWIESVTFVLHETFDRPERTVTTAPFQVTEFGWGEFVVMIVVRLKHVAQPITLQHLIQFSIRPRLPHCVPPDGRKYVKEEAVPYQQETLPSVNEFADELVVQNPPAALVSAVSSLLTQSALASKKAGVGVTCWNEIKKYGSVSLKTTPQDDIAVLTELKDQLHHQVVALRQEVSLLTAKSVAKALKV